MPDAKPMKRSRPSHKKMLTNDPAICDDIPLPYKRSMLSLINLSPVEEKCTSHFHATTQSFYNTILLILKSLYSAQEPEKSRRELSRATMHLLALKKFDKLLPSYEIADSIEQYIGSLLTDDHLQPIQACQITLKIIGNLLVCSDALRYFPKFDPDDPIEEIQVLLFDGLINKLGTISHTISQSSYPGQISPKCLELIETFQEKMLRFGRVATHPIYKKNEDLLIDLHHMLPYEGIQQTLIDVSHKFYPYLS